MKKSRLYFAAIWKDGQVIKIYFSDSCVNLVNSIKANFFKLQGDYATSCNEDQKIGDSKLSCDGYAGGDITDFKYSF